MLKIGFLASHGGSGMKAILQAIANGLKADPCLLICNSPHAVAFKIAKQQGMATFHLSAKTHRDPHLLDQSICATLQQQGVDLVLLSGYMKKLGAITLAAYENRILNIHPALLPAFGGHNMYGDRVHQAVLDSGQRRSGATVHLVDAEYDRGPILKQQIINLDKDETLDSLREKIKAIEGALYTQTLADIVNGKIILP